MRRRLSHVGAEVASMAWAAEFSAASRSRAAQKAGCSTSGTCTGERGAWWGCMMEQIMYMRRSEQKMQGKQDTLEMWNAWEARALHLWEQPLDGSVVLGDDVAAERRDLQAQRLRRGMHRKSLGSTAEPMHVYAPRGLQVLQTFRGVLGSRQDAPAAPPSVAA